MKLASAKKKGREWESAIVGYLRDHGFKYAERRRLSGLLDQGDITGVPGVMIEAKSEAAPSVGTYMAEVDRQTRNAAATIGVAWVKRPGRQNPGQGVVLTRASTLVNLGYLGDVTDAQARLGDLLAHEALFQPVHEPRVLIVRTRPDQRPVMAMSGQLFVDLLQPVEVRS